MNDELGDGLVKELGSDKARFLNTNVLETESIAAAVKGSLAWVKETGKEVGGVIAAAGVSSPAKVGKASLLSFFFILVELTIGVLYLGRALLSTKSYMIES